MGRRRRTTAAIDEPRQMHSTMLTVSHLQLSPMSSSVYILVHHLSIQHRIDPCLVDHSCVCRVWTTCSHRQNKVWGCCEAQIFAFLHCCRWCLEMRPKLPKSTGGFQNTNLENLVHVPSLLHVPYRSLLQRSSTPRTSTSPFASTLHTSVVKRKELGFTIG